MTDTSSATDRRHAREQRARRRLDRRRAAVPVALGLAMVGGGAWVLGGVGAQAEPRATVPLRLHGPSPSTTIPSAPVGSADSAAASSGIAAAPIGTVDALLSSTPPPVANPPAGITIGSIGVTAAVTPVGIDELGDVAVPPDVSQAGWYRFGPEPGADGSSVIVAHVDYNGHEGPFFRLGRVRPGDIVTVTAADGTVHRFSVSQTGRYPKDQLPTADLFRTDGVPRLVLITCGGEFQRSRRSYADNVVVVADPIP